MKSRAGTTIIDNCDLTANYRDPTGSSAQFDGAVMDIPNGGQLKVTNSRLNLPLGVGNTLWLNFGADGDWTPGASKAEIDTTTFTDGTGTGGLFNCLQPNVSIIVTGDTEIGAKPPGFNGWATTNGTITQKAA